VTPRLLLLDDDAAIVSVVRRYFDGRGWQVETCLEASEGLSLVESDERFDAVICDLHFTPARLSEGFQIIDRARRKRPGVAVLLFTGAAESGVKEEALRLGASDVVTKPTPLASLHDAVLRAMKGP
jgi:CheY-like chemotaxis protein